MLLETRKASSVPEKVAKTLLAVVYAALAVGIAILVNLSEIHWCHDREDPNCSVIPGG